MTFQDQQLNSMTFQACKMKFFNSMTFQVFHDLYEPWLMISFTELRGQLPFPKDMKALSVHAALVKMVRILINNPLSQVLFKFSVCGIQPFENELM